MNKSEIMTAILSKLREEFETRQASSKKVRQAGNDGESKAEDKYDTRSTEENYLADGLARQALVAVEAAVQLEKMPLRDFQPDEPIDQGALIKLDFGSVKEWFFLAPAGGGTEIETSDGALTVITPESPLGRELLDKTVGTKLRQPTAKILKVC